MGTGELQAYLDGALDNPVVTAATPARTLVVDEFNNDGVFRCRPPFGRR